MNDTFILPYCFFPNFSFSVIYTYIRIIKIFLLGGWQYSGEKTAASDEHLNIAIVTYRLCYAPPNRVVRHHSAVTQMSESARKVLSNSILEPYYSQIRDEIQTSTSERNLIANDVATDYWFRRTYG